MDPTAMLACSGSEGSDLQALFAEGDVFAGRESDPPTEMAVKVAAARGTPFGKAGSEASNQLQAHRRAFAKWEKEKQDLWLLDELRKISTTKRWDLFGVTLRSPSQWSKCVGLGWPRFQRFWRQVVAPPEGIVCLPPDGRRCSTRVYRDESKMKVESFLHWLYANVGEPLAEVPDSREHPFLDAELHAETKALLQKK